MTKEALENKEALARTERLAALALSPGWADLAEVLAFEEQGLLEAMRNQKDTQSLLFWTRYWQQFRMFRDAVIKEPAAARELLEQVREEAEKNPVSPYYDAVYHGGGIIESEPE